MKLKIQKAVACTLAGAMAFSCTSTVNAVEIIQASNYSDASSKQDTTEMFADLSRQIAGESIVMLENNGVLPLESGSRITLISAGSFRLSGSGSGGSNASEEATITPAEGIEANSDLVLVREVKDEEQQGGMFGPPESTEPEAEEELAKDFTEFVSSEEKAAEYAADSDTAVIWISRSPGEGNDRYAVKGDWYLSDEEETALEYATKYFENVVVFLNLPNIDMAWVDEYDVDAVLLYGYAGAQGGNAVADVLSGAVNPSGKLTDTLASIESYPSTPNFDTFALAVEEFTMTDSSLRHFPWWLDTPNPAYGYDNGTWIRPYDEYYFTKYEEGIYNGYRYFTTFEDIIADYNAGASEEDQAAFEVYYDFGYGLSYTDFEVEIVDYTLPEEIPSTENDLQISITAKVTNTGDTAGKDVVQFYYGAPDGVLENPSMELVSFAKTEELQPGQSQEVTVTFDVYDMADWYEEDAAYILMGGDYGLYVGDSLDGARENSITYTLDAEDYTVVREGSNLAGPDQEGGTYDQYLDAFPEIELTELSKYDYENTKPDGEEGIRKNDTAIEDQAIDSDGAKRNRYEAVINGEDGTENYESPDKDVSSQEYYTDLLEKTNEAIAEAQNLYEEEGKAQYQLLDVYEGNCTMEEFLEQWTDIELCTYVLGAGRIGQQFGDEEQEEGARNPDGVQGNARLGVPEFSVSDGPNKVGTSNGCTTTAWPCGTNRAQTWNEELIYELGQATGYECLAGSTEILLGPALNIHRNPLCGRNYEYFSEDPVLTGVMASALVSGIQESGCGVSLKHYAANQMEGENNDRWNKLDSIMSERTLREIYLKNFEIVIKNANPTSLMTSYNMVNGKYASCADELLQIAKEEWGFNGISMTDWSGDWGNAVAMFQTATDLGMPSNIYMLTYLYTALTISQEEGRGLSYQEAGGNFDIGRMLTREDLETIVQNTLNTTMRMKVFADYYGLDYSEISDYQATSQFDVTLGEIE